MTVIGGDQAANSLQMLQFITQLDEQKKKEQHDKALALLNSMHPGETLGSIPGALKAYKTATGIEGDPNRVLSEETMSHLLEKTGAGAILGMSPELQKALAVTRVLNASTGTTGPQTEESYKSTAVANEASAGAQAIARTAAAKSLAAAPPATQAAVGQRQIFGETGATTVATEKKTVAEANVTAAQAKVVEEFYGDPENSNLGKYLTTNGIDPKAAAQAFASGQGSLLTGIIDMKQAIAVAKEETKRTGMTIQGKLMEDLNKGRIDSMQKFSETTGIPLRTGLAIENAIETGHNPLQPYKTEDGQTYSVDPMQVQAYLKAKQLGYTSYIREQVAKNNPHLTLLKTLSENGQKFKSDPKLLTAYNTIAAADEAQVVTEGEMGMPRPTEAGELQDVWDKQFILNYHNMGMISKDPSSFLGIDIMSADPVNTQLPAGLRTDRGVNLKGGKKPAEPSGTQASAVDSGTGAVVNMQNPDAAKALQAVVGWGQDSTLIKR